MLEILQIIKENYNNFIEKYPNGGFQSGLCNIAKRCLSIDVDDVDDYDKFRNYLKEVNKNQKVFYNFNGLSKNINEGDLTEYGFHWNPNDTKSRLKWLNKQIKIESQKLNNE